MLAGCGYWALLRTPIDAIPDLSENQVIVFTDWAGRSPQEVEDQITYPLTVNLQGLPHVRTVRSASAFGFSMVNVIFEDSVDIYFARTRVLERLSLAGSFLPAGVTPMMGPDATGVGQVFWYTVGGSLRQRHAALDSGLVHQVPAQLRAWSRGGRQRRRLRQAVPDRPRSDEAARLQHRTKGRSRRGRTQQQQRRRQGDGGGQTPRTWFAASASFGGLKDIEDISLGAYNGTPVTVGNVASVQLGPEFRRGVLDKDGKEAVGGVVVIRYGANAREVIAAIKQKIDEIQPGLPAGVKIVPFYDRSILIDHAVDTLRHALIEEILLVTLAHVLFLWHFRSILVVTIPLPLAVLGAFLFMRGMDISSNIMSLGGIAIAIGVLVDAGIVMTENVIRQAEQYEHEHGNYREHIWEITLNAARLVGRPISFAMVIIILAFVPVFALTGMEGKMFHPLAFTKTFAMLCSTIMAITLVPVLCTFLIRGKLHREDENPIMRVLRAIYRPTLSWALRHRTITLTAALALFCAALYTATTIGSEFMPPLDEETALFMPITDPRISLTKATEILRQQDAIIAADPQVAMVVGKVGRAETSTDPAPVNMSETTITFKPKDQWPKGLTKDAILARLDDELQIPGVTNIWTQPIRNRIDMLSTGIRTQIGIKVFGPDLRVIEQKSEEIKEVVQQIPGAVDLYAERTTGAPYLEMTVDRAAADRYGLNVADVEDAIETAVGGKNLTTTIEGRQRFPVRVRYARDFRENPQQLGEVLVTGSNGAQVPLSKVVNINTTMGPSMISSENGLLRGAVLLNVRGRDVGGFVDQAKRAVAQQVKMPPGYYVEWSGQYENQISARKRLELVIPIVLLVIFALLYRTYNSAKEAAHVLLAVPFALSGGVFLVKLLGLNFSVAVWVGFIALFGTAVQTGVVMVIYLKEAVARRIVIDGRLTIAGLHTAVMEGALLRLRPKVMTVATVVAGLLPLLWSTRTGAEFMRPLAAPVLGGMLSSLVHVLIVTPVIFTWLRERELRGEQQA